MLRLRQSRDRRRALRWCYARGYENAPLRERFEMLCSWLLLALVAAAQGRAVNISNTWVLPEEGFPVFYRYFRDRISWYEADAVCQFHHANLVTVDTTAQYDAVRAYLKELDISSAVWVGLIRSNPDGDFTWTDYRGLSGDGYWSSAPDARSAPLCAASDPAADYRWEARACGGPSVASFICELPVPQWALGNEGCMVRALPALTVLYLPESAAVQLTADCGMAGVKRVQCTGNVKHEDLIRDLSCNQDDEASSMSSISSTVTTWATAEAEQETSDAAIEENITTERDDDNFTLNSITPTPILIHHISVTQKKNIVKNQSPQNNDNALNKNINLDVTLHNNLQSNDIPKLVVHDDFHLNEQLEKQEDEKHMQHKLLHNELARLGNYENIFSQPTDHFVPPLVMAKAKVNDDMTAISFEEKLAQQHSEYRLTKYEDENNDTLHTKLSNNEKITTTEVLSTLFTTEVPISRTTDPIKDKKEINKNVLPKKYDHSFEDIKSKLRSQPAKFTKANKLTTFVQTEATKMESETTTLKNVVYFDSSDEDSSLDLTVNIKEPESSGIINSNSLNTSNTINLSSESKHNASIDHKEQNYLSTTQESLIGKKSSTESNIVQNFTLNDEIIKITFVRDDDNSQANSTVYEITTRSPIFKDTNENSFHVTSPHTGISIENADISITSSGNIASTAKFEVTPRVETKDAIKATDLESVSAHVSNNITSGFLNIDVTTQQYLTENTHGIDTNISSAEVTPYLTDKDIINNITEPESLDYYEKHFNNTSQDINDFQSPLLSGANEPLHKPNRSRRPQQPNRIKKFNPFRILG